MKMLIFLNGGKGCAIVGKTHVLGLPGQGSCRDHHGSTPRGHKLHNTKCRIKFNFQQGKLPFQHIGMSKRAEGHK
jgi:hypothetical protein